VRLAAAILAAIVLLLVVAQLVLPGIAAERVSERIEPYGSVRAVHVHAVPAIELLWGDAQEIVVSAGPLRASMHQLVDLQQSLEGVGEARLSSPRLELVLSSLAAGEVPLEGVLLSKRGNSLSASGTVRHSAVNITLPGGFRVDGLSAGSGQPEVSVSGEAFGVHVSGRAVVTARGGAIVVEPAGLPFSSFATLTLYSDPRIYVESVSASERGEGVLVTLRARPAS